jgi:hypothetical protein
VSRCGAGSRIRSHVRIVIGFSAAVRGESRMKPPPAVRSFAGTPERRQDMSATSKAEILKRSVGKARLLEPAVR